MQIHLLINMMSFLEFPNCLDITCCTFIFTSLRFLNCSYIWITPSLIIIPIKLTLDFIHSLIYSTPKGVRKKVVFAQSIKKRKEGMMIYLWEVEGVIFDVWLLLVDVLS